MHSDTQTERARFFRQLHQRGNPFVLVNVWDAGGAKAAAAAGAAAIATTSAGHARTLGKSDLGRITRDESLAHAAAIAAATNAPVSGDCENGYGHSPEDVAATVRACIAAGLAGCSIEDTMLPDLSPYSFADSVLRIKTAAAAARDAADDFVITARADGVMHGHYDVDEAIRRLRAFESVGADVLYAPEPPDMESLARICDSVSSPVNALAAGAFCRYSLADFARIGTARVSLGSALSRAAWRAEENAVRDILQNGSFALLREENE